MKKDGSRLIMCIILLFEEFLVRDASLPRAKLDAGQMNPFWDKFAVAFNSDNPFLDTMYGNQHGHFTSLGLDSKKTGFVATGVIMKAKFTEIRASYMSIMVTFGVKRVRAKTKRWKAPS